MADMLNDDQIINQGLAIISATRVSKIAEPRTTIEHFVAERYQQWRESELTKRRWVFATEDDYQLTQVAVIDNTSHPYKYGMPVNCLRPIRNKYTEWKQRGRFIFSALSSLKISYVRNAANDELDPLFIDVLAARVAVECAEFVTQSTVKADRARAAYAQAVEDAGKVNAFIIGTEDIQADDGQFEWLNARSTGIVS